MRVLITGGAGYIGSHALKALLAQGHEAIVVDDLRTGHRAAVRGAPLFVTPIHDRARVALLLAEHRIEAVMHFAASCYVGESVERPLDYADNNVAGTLRLIQACVDAGVSLFVLSSTAAVYGVPAADPIHEDLPREPVNPYGRSKRTAEDLLLDAAAAHGLRPVFLRYFNAAGADPEGELGEDHAPETHLIPNAILAALGRRAALEVYGADYETPDGTCVRDYVHVADLAQAHLLALEAMARGAIPAGRAFNLGNGSGYSVNEVVAAVRRVTGADFAVAVRPRRPGDPPKLVASSARARAELGWRPRFAALETIVETAWRWMKAHPHGYGS